MAQGVSLGRFCCWPECRSEPREDAPVCTVHLIEAVVIASESGEMSLFNRPEPTPKVERPEGVVYYVRLRDGLVKIGHTTSLRARLSGLRLPMENVLATEPGPRALEAMRHQQFAHLRHGRLEDFDAAPELMSHIDMLNEHYAAA